jgi:hypothetical protein
MMYSHEYLCTWRSDVEVNVEARGKQCMRLLLLFAFVIAGSDVYLMDAIVRTTERKSISM